MSKDLSKSELIQILVEDYGEIASALESKDALELLSMYHQHKKKRILEVCDIVSGQCEDTAAMHLKKSEGTLLDEHWHELISYIDDPAKTYLIVDEMVKNYHMHEIDVLLDKCTNEELYNKIYKKFRIKYRQYQEEMLVEIEESLDFLPDGERYNRMRELEKRKSDINYLRQQYNMVTNPANQELMNRISHAKDFVLHEFFPESHKKEYHAYHQMTVVHGELMEKLLKLTKRYSEEDLKKMTPEELAVMEEYYRESKERADKEKAKLDKYMNAFLEIMHETGLESERKFRRTIGSMFIELDNGKILDIIKEIKDQSDTFGEKLYTAYLAYLNDEKK